MEYVQQIRIQIKMFYFYVSLLSFLFSFVKQSLGRLGLEKPQKKNIFLMEGGGRRGKGLSTKNNFL